MCVLCGVHVQVAPHEWLVRWGDGTSACYKCGADNKFQLSYMVGGIQVSYRGGRPLGEVHGWRRPRELQGWEAYR